VGQKKRKLVPLFKPKLAIPMQVDAGKNLQASEQ
jgi:hypothetical protein